MADAAPDIVASLTQDEIPVKLRCASCNKLVVSAFRLPCCDQNVCENCQNSLPESCPVCMHSPLSPDDCKPNKSLRLTVKAFLKSEEKKRNKEQGGAQAVGLHGGPSATATSLAELPTPPVDAVGDDNEPQERHTTFEPTAQIEHAPSSPSSSIEITLEPPNYEERVPQAPGFTRQSQQNQAALYHGSVQEVNIQGHSSVKASLESAKYFPNSDSQPMLNPAGFDFMGVNNFGTMASPGDFNSMMAMQNAISPPNWSGFTNMMGMPGMGMDFMSGSPGTFGGFNGQGIGLNGMNGLNMMGMGFDGSYGGWTSHSAIGLNNGGGGNFGANAGCYPGSEYNHQSQQKHFNQMHHQQFPMNNYKQNHFNGQGYKRGYDRDHGRQMGHFQQQNRFSQGMNKDKATTITQGSGDTPKVLVQPQGETQGITSQSTAAIIHGAQQNQADVTNVEQERKKLDEPTAINVIDDELNDEDEQLSKVQPSNVSRIDDNMKFEEKTRETSETVAYTAEESAAPQPIPAVVSSELPLTHVNVRNEVSDMLAPEFSAPLGPAAHFSASNSMDLSVRGKASARGIPRAIYTGRGGPRGHASGSLSTTGHFSSVASEGNTFQTAVATGKGVEGAPTGPKAMRDGLPNVGFRGRGSLQSADKSGLQDRLPGNSTKAGSMSSQELEKRRSQSPSQLTSNNHYRHRKSRSRSSINSTEDASERERRSSHTRRHSRQNGDVQSSEVKLRTGDCTPESISRSYPRLEIGKRQSSRHEHDRHRKKSRYRSKSPANYDPGSNGQASRSSETSRHRSTRDSTRHQGNGTGREGSHKRSRRDRSVSTHREHDRQDRDQGPYDHHRNLSSNSALRGKHGIQDRPMSREFKIKDRSKRTELDFQKQIVMDGNPNVDSHTLEREARNRERLLKEQQRRDSLVASSSTKKRSGDALEESAGYKTSKRRVRHENGGNRQERRTSYHYDESDEGKESRALRVEFEREAARWV